MREVKRSQGFTWGHGYYDTVDGPGKPRSTCFFAGHYSTKFNIRKALELQLRMLNTCFGGLIFAGIRMK